MRIAQSAKLAAKLRKQHLKLLGDCTNSPSVSTEALSSSFGPYTNLLPPSLRTELLDVRLQEFPQRIELFKKLHHTGDIFLMILINKYLGTRNVQLPHTLVKRFCESRNIGDSAESGTKLLKQSIGAVSLFVGEEQAGDMVFKHILGGPQGLSNMYLNALYSGELDEI